jgi:hypothetical protein
LLFLTGIFTVAALVRLARFIDAAGGLSTADAVVLLGAIVLAVSTVFYVRRSTKSG